MRPIHLALAIPLLLGPARAQERVVDEGSFVILRAGAPVGRENFRIVRAAAAGGQAFRATARIALNEERITTTLTTDSLGAPLSYDLAVTVGAATETTLRGSGRPGRFSALIRTKHGESARDYIVGENPLVLDASVFHQYYFATLMPRRARFAVLEPRTERQSVLRFEDRGEESRQVGRHAVTARHLSLIAADGSTRDVWVDSGGRLLRVEIPATGLAAQREDLPR